MIDLTLLQPRNHRETPPGCLFVPVAKDEERFLSGRINAYPVMVALDGARPFHVGPTESWTRQSGLVIAQGHFQVQLETAMSIGSAVDAPLGALVLAGLGTMLIAEDDNGRKAVLLGGGRGSTGLDEGAVAFTSWRFVTGEGAALAVHFEHSAK